MASEVTICNLALSRLGDDANVTSIDPPDGSAQAGHCALWFPVARDSLLEMHTWAFATKRVTLAPLNNEASTWRYAYAAPSDMVNPLAVLDAQAPDDYSSSLYGYGTAVVGTPYGSAGSQAGTTYTPQPYALELNSSGASVILTNQDSAVLRYTSKVVDTTRFSPLFVEGLVLLLASHLAGPVLKGTTGASAASALLREFQVWLGKATASDANQRQRGTQMSVPWITARR